MYPYYQNQPSYGQYSSFKTFNQEEGTQERSSSSALIDRQCDLIDERANVISSAELSGILDKLLTEIERFPQQKQQIANLKDVITVLIQVRKPILKSVIQHRFFTLLPNLLNSTLRRWDQNSDLGRNDQIVFRNATKLLEKSFRELTQTEQYPSWFTDASLLDPIVVCLGNLSTSEKYFQAKNQLPMKVFIRLFDLYNDYQDLLNSETNTDQDKLGRLLDPVVQCLTSNFYLDSFDKVKNGASLRSKQVKFFLTRCPEFLSSYNGSRLEHSMTHLLPTMLPKYTNILDQSISSVNRWEPSMVRAVTHLLDIVNQGSVNPNLISNHISFIDHVLTIINVPKFYDNVQNKLSNPETNLIHTAMNLLVNYIGEPAVLTHIKQKKMTPTFLRLTSAKYEPLVYNIYTLLAYTTSEEDIKSMQNPGVLLSTVVNGLKSQLEGKSVNQDRLVQLIETLKGLTQHDQLKEEILKQNIVSFLLQSSSRLPQVAITPLLETFWSLSFSPEGAAALRTFPELLQRVQVISKDAKDEALKKAADGLVWKLIREPALLDKVAKGAADDDTTVTTQVVIGADGKEQVITTTKKAGAGTQAERTFQYDIMISYCHADKELIKKIHKFLVDEGFKVWIDLDNMFGPAMNAMADAVENSEFVLLSMSDSYKQSTYCQAEAEYAFGCKRRLVPLIVRPGYRADGWLGFMIGSRIYIDYGSFDFETACEKLINEITRQRQRPLPSKPGQNSNPTTTGGATKAETAGEESDLFSQKFPARYTTRTIKFDFDIKSVDFWLESDVLDFLYNHQLNELMPLCEKMDGRALVQLYKMCAARHNRTYIILNDQLKAMYNSILPIGTYTRFLNLMEELITPPMQYMLPPPPIRLMLPPPPPTRLMLPPPPPPPANFSPPSSNLPYDILVTSDVPISQMLNLIERVGSNWHMKNYA